MREWQCARPKVHFLSHPWVFIYQFTSSQTKKKTLQFLQLPALHSRENSPFLPRDVHEAHSNPYGRPTGEWKREREARQEQKLKIFSTWKKKSQYDRVLDGRDWKYYFEEKLFSRRGKPCWVWHVGVGRNWKRSTNWPIVLILLTGWENCLLIRWIAKVSLTRKESRALTTPDRTIKLL